MTVSDDEYRALLVSRGMSEPDAEMLTKVFAACREGEFAAVDPTLADLLGRPAMSMREVLGAELSNRDPITTGGETFQAGRPSARAVLKGRS